MSNSQQQYLDILTRELNLATEGMSALESILFVSKVMRKTGFGLSIEASASGLFVINCEKNTSCRKA